MHESSSSGGYDKCDSERAIAHAKGAAGWFSIDFGGEHEENIYGGIMRKTSRREPLSESEYLALAEFRYLIRKFLRQMEDAARKAGYSPQHYQLLLAVKGLPRGMRPSISVLADRMQLNHNSTVELVDRCEARGLLRRVPYHPDRRQVTLEITA